GRALEALARWEEAASAYARYAATPPARSSGQSASAEARRARALARTGAWDGALATARALAANQPALADWAALEAPRRAVDGGGATVVAGLLATVADPAVRLRGWDLEPRALLAARDSAAALAALDRVRPELAVPAARADAWVLTGELRRARGDGSGAR